MATAGDISSRSMTPARPGRWSSRPSRWWRLSREILFVVSGVLVYFGVRGITVTDAQEALDHALHLVELERSLGLYIEPSLQALVIGSDSMVALMNWVYIWGHWPVIAVVLVWLFFAHPEGYRRTRNAMLFSGGIGLLIFAAFPVAPPRLADLGFIDTVSENSSAYRVLQPPAFVNQYAAMPSLHVGWDLLMGLAIYTYARHVLLRVAGVMLPVLMVSSVVLTANHYIIDAAGGALLVVASMLVVRRFERRRGRAEPVDALQQEAMVPEQRTSPDSVADGQRLSEAS